MALESESGADPRSTAVDSSTSVNKRFLRCEVGVEAAGRKTGFLHHLVDSRRMIAFASEDPARRLENLGPRLFLVTGGVTHYSPRLIQNETSEPACGLVSIHHQTFVRKWTRGVAKQTRRTKPTRNSITGVIQRQSMGLACARRRCLGACESSIVRTVKSSIRTGRGSTRRTVGPSVPAWPLANP